MLFATVMLAFGAGCSVPTIKNPVAPAGPKTSALDGLSPEDAAKKVNFTPGSVIEMRQTFLGFGAKLAAALAGEKKEGTRVIVVSRFAPMETANVEWKLSTQVETDASKKARAAASAAGKPVPEPVMVEQASEGSVNGFDLRETHTLYLPALWPEKKDAPNFGTSGIWLSRDVYEGLARNRVATLDFGMLDPTLTSVVSKLTDFQKAFALLATKKAIVEDRTDVFRLDGDKDAIEWPLKVNGKDVKVAAIKAHTWFGEIIVLQNPQNPLILKATLNPATMSISDVLSGAGLLNALVGYEVTEIKDAQE